MIIVADGNRDSLPIFIKVNNGNRDSLPIFINVESWEMSNNGKEKDNLFILEDGKIICLSWKERMEKKDS